MPDNEIDAPVTESSDQPISQETELPSMAEALRSAQAQEHQSTDDDGDESDESDADDDTPVSDDEPSEQDAAAQDADSAKPSRPNQARRLKQRVTELEAETQMHKGRADFYESENQQRQAQVKRLLDGDNDEFTRLWQKRQDPNQALDWDEEQRYAQLHAERQNAALYVTQYQRAFWNDNAQDVRDRASKHGLNADELLPMLTPQVGSNNVVGPLIDKVISATEARVRAEMQDDIDRLTADRDSARLKLGGKAHDPGMGGRSGTHRNGDPNWDTSEPSDWFAAAAKENGRRT